MYNSPEKTQDGALRLKCCKDALAGTPTACLVWTCHGTPSHILTSSLHDRWSCAILWIMLQHVCFVWFHHVPSIRGIQHCFDHAGPKQRSFPHNHHWHCRPPELEGILAIDHLWGCWIESSMVLSGYEYPKTGRPKNKSLGCPKKKVAIW